MSAPGKQRCPCKCHPDLSWLSCPGATNHFSDIDALFALERRGRYLIMECKRNDESLTSGQNLMLRGLSCLKAFTVILLAFADGDPVEITRYENGKPLMPETTDRADLQRRLDAWYALAHALPRMRPYFDDLPVSVAEQYAQLHTRVDN